VDIGDPESDANVPVPGLSEYIEIESPVSLATYAYVPVGSMVIESAPAPAPNGDPPIAARAPPQG
jgi:hypothetical protein